MYRSKPGGPDGRTLGNDCGYCVKHFLSQIKTLTATKNSLQMHETLLSNDANSLQTHKTTIDQIIKTIIERGGDLRSHMCW